MNSEQINLLNSIKGAPACILWALIFHGKPVDRNHLVIATGYTPNTVTKGLSILEELYLVERLSRREGWQLTDRLDQLDLPGLYLEEYSEEDEDHEALFGDEEKEWDRGENQPPLDKLTGKVNNLPSGSTFAERKVKKSLSENESIDKEVNNSLSEIETFSQEVNNSLSENESIDQEINNSPAGSYPVEPKVKNSLSMPEIVDQEVNNSLLDSTSAERKVKNSLSGNEINGQEVNNSLSEITTSAQEVKNSLSRPEKPQVKVKKSPLPRHSFNSVVEIYPPNTKNVISSERVSTEKTIGSTKTRASDTALSQRPADRPGPTANLPGDSPGPAAETSPAAKPTPARKYGSHVKNLSEGLDPRVLRAFRSAGLMLTPRTRLLALKPYVSPRYVRAHFARLKAEGKASSTGLLVAILESGIPAPELYPNGHLTTCTCDECDRHYRYLP